MTKRLDWLFAALIGISLAWLCATFDEEAEMLENRMAAQNKYLSNSAVVGGVTYNKQGIKQP